MLWHGALPQMLESRQQPRPAPGCAALHRSLRDAEYLGGVGDRVAEHIDQDECGLLVRDKPLERGPHVDSGVTAS